MRRPSSSSAAAGRSSALPASPVCARGRAERRQARFEKWQEVEPNNEYQHSYRDLIEPVLNLRPWKPRPVDLPVLHVSTDIVDAALEDAEHPALEEILDRPALSAIIISLGQVAGPMIAGLFADATGNYRAGFTVLALIAGSGSLLFLMAKKPPAVGQAARP